MEFRVLTATKAELLNEIAKLKSDVNVKKIIRYTKEELIVVIKFLKGQKK